VRTTALKSASVGMVELIGKTLIHYIVNENLCNFTRDSEISQFGGLGEIPNGVLGVWKLLKVVVNIVIQLLRDQNDTKLKMKL